MSDNSQERKLLEVRGLKKHFPIKGGILGSTVANVFAVDGVDLDIKKGETVGLVGESGCGKSTLGRSILRLYEPTAGGVYFDGADLLSLGKEELRQKRREMQIIFQDPFSSLNPRMTVGEILSEPYKIHKMIKEARASGKILKLLDTVGLPRDAFNKYPHEFSGGQRQRIGIARAIALHPKLIVADEPVSALDVSIQSQILNLMVDLRKEFDLSYLFIAHDLSVVEHISDTVAVMYLGKIVEHTTGDQLYEKPLHPYTQALISAIPEAVVNKDRKKRQILTGDVPSPMNPPKGCHFSPRCPLATDLCHKERPKLVNKATSSTSLTKHLVSCHHVDEY